MMEKLFIGDIKIPCAGEKYMEPIGDKFVPRIDTDTTKDTEAVREKKEMTKGMSVGEEDKVIGVELEEKKNRLRPPKMIALDSTAETITWQLSEPDPELKIDKYQVRGEGEGESDDQRMVEPDNVQVSCWDHLTTNHQRDLPCCLVRQRLQRVGN